MLFTLNRHATSTVTIAAANDDDDDEEDEEEGESLLLLVSRFLSSSLARQNALLGTRTGFRPGIVSKFPKNSASETRCLIVRSDPHR